ncbi:hypothetical protein HDC90_001151 [Pedobacter sp. AK013]|uniref:hypothetical protein n=1 Tax=Pedobacter sp. AK013 TaxID=2723071 RepID=UPI00161FBBA7|nr:hypothetical protein [Pedobacter sp. AK013]MBB6236539.1 hypothetical protein [Pedobacter sp. AK013]
MLRVAYSVNSEPTRKQKAASKKDLIHEAALSLIEFRTAKDDIEADEMFADEISELNAMKSELAALKKRSGKRI